MNDCIDHYLMISEGLCYMTRYIIAICQTISEVKLHNCTEGTVAYPGLVKGDVQHVFVIFAHAQIVGDLQCIAATCGASYCLLTWHWG